MAGATNITRGPIWQGTSAVLLARVRNQAGQYVTQASLLSILYSIFDFTSSTPDTPIASALIPISSVIFDALQVDARWPIDTIGYNFAWVAPGSLFPNAPNDYRVKITFTGTDGSVFPLVFQPRTQPLP